MQTLSIVQARASAALAESIRCATETPHIHARKVCQARNRALAGEYRDFDMQPRYTVDGGYVWLNFAAERTRMTEQERKNQTEQRRADWLGKRHRAT